MAETGDAQSQAQKPTAEVLQAKLNQGIALHRQGKLADAERCYREVLQRQPNHFAALHLLGVISGQTGRSEEGVELIKRAIGLNPKVAEAHNNLGNALRDLKRHEEALASYDQAIVLKQDYANAHNNRGNVLRDLKRPEEAQASYDRAIALKPAVAEAHNNRGNALMDLKRPAEALASYDEAIALKPDYAEAHSNRGAALRDLKRPAEALASYDRAIALKPDYANAHNNRGNVLRDLKRPAEALASYDKALALTPDSVGAEGMRVHTKMHICDWINFDSECAHLISSVKHRTANTIPFAFLGISSSSDDQLQCAKLWVTEKCPPSQKPIWRGEHYRHDRIRVAYVSADFHQSATSYLMAGMFEYHDKSRFEVTGISIGSEDSDEMRQRLLRSFDHFIDAKALSDAEVASRIRETEIDILIDLKGFTQDAQTNVFAQRPAPIQVNYLGYPGTMGASYIDYIIADQTVIPDESRKFYSEKIVVLPNTYQVNDRTRIVSDKAFNRSAAGLPSQGVVFCCFNNTYKITPYVFDRWMRLLRQVGGSVLWLLEDNASAASNLRKEAVARSVRPERLVFAERIQLPEHLARHKLADLFLDTLPVNAHTTASDALWAGLPVLTQIGETFAGRVAASLLNAIGLPELITSTPQAYEALAIELATNPEKLAAIKRKLANNRLTTPLFDTQTFTRHIEAAYTIMHERYQANLPPDHIYVSQ
jgi:predicted O-linked N-acetylglucosamine transferase (SPINDLY family)